VGGAGSGGRDEIDDGAAAGDPPDRDLLHTNVIGTVADHHSSSEGDCGD